MKHFFYVFDLLALFSFLLYLSLSRTSIGETIKFTAGMQRNNWLTSAPDQNKSNTLEYDGTQKSY